MLQFQEGAHQLSGCIEATHPSSQEQLRAYPSSWSMNFHLQIPPALNTAKTLQSTSSHERFLASPYRHSTYHTDRPNHPAHIHSARRHQLAGLRISTNPVTAMHTQTSSQDTLQPSSTHSTILHARKVRKIIPSSSTRESLRIKDYHQPQRRLFHLLAIFRLFA